MNRQERSGFDECAKASGTAISRRGVMGCSGAAVLGLLSTSALGQEAVRPRPEGEMPPEIRERMERSRAFSERMRSAGGPEEMRKIMEERRAWDRGRAVEDLKAQLEIAEAEWTVIRPRIEAVYNLVHPLVQMGPGTGQSRTEVEQRRRDLQELLRDEKAPVEQIKAKLMAFRAARERSTQELSKARQNLRQVLTLRQEAVLVLHGLLD